MGRLETALIAAVEGHDLERVQALLAQGADPEARKGKRRVWDLVHPRREDIRWALAEAGADPGGGGLLWAVRSGRPSLVTALLRRGAGPDGGDAPTTPLVEAIRRRHVEVALALLAAGADPRRAQEVERLTPLAAAARGGLVEVVRALLDAGVDPTPRDGEGCTALDLASANGHAAVTDLLRARGGHVERHPAERLLAAAEAGDAPGIVAALAAGAGVEARDARDGTRGFTALIHAARRGSLPGVEALLAAGARVDAGDGVTHDARALRFAFGHGGEAAALACGGLGRAPLAWAASGGHLEVARALLDAGAPVGHADVLERTALHVAAEAGHLDVVLLLLERGADPGATTYDRETPLTLATAARHGHVAAHLASLEPGKPSARALKEAAAAADLALVRTLLERGARPGKGALAAAAGALFWEELGPGMRTLRPYPEARVLEVVRALLDAGADLESPDAGGTPLEQARRWGHQAVVRMLQAARRKAAKEKGARPPTKRTKRGH